MSTTRRSVLKGVSFGAGAALLAPMVRQIRGADNKAAAPKRVVFVLQSNGFHPWAAQPKGLERSDQGPDAVVDLPLADYELPDDLAPLAEYKHLTTLVQRLSGRHCNPWHTAGFGALGGVRKSTLPLAQTIDAALARAMPAPFPLLNLGVWISQRKAPENGLAPVCSAWGADKPIATQVNPNLAYKALFGAAAKKIDEGGPLLDGIADDVRRVNQQLTPEEREQFAEHLDAFESFDQKRELFQQPQNHEATATIPQTDARYGSSLESKRLEAQFELAAAALISGQTNVVTIASGACAVNGFFEGVGVDKFEIHAMGHFNGLPEITWEAAYTKLRQLHFRYIAQLVDKLRQASGPDGSPLMDETLIVYTSDGAETHHSAGDEWPFVLIGSCGGRLRTGRFIEYPAAGQPANRTINALYSTLLHATGHPRDDFNLDSEEGKVDKPGPLTELLA